MKKFTLSLLACLVVALGFAQSRFASVAPQAVPARAVKNSLVPVSPLNGTVQSKATLEDIIGTTVYDMQTNASIDPRLRVFPDGTKAGVWTRGTMNSSERGTGYNYNDGTTWGPPPSSRIENDRTGWPSYAPLGPTGEIVIAHLNDGLKVSQRPVRGQGTWNQTVMMGPAGATDISWPRIMTNGPTNNYIHMMVNTYVVYEGLDLALLYYRSLDGGLTWDKNGVILPQMSSADYDGFNGDQVTWGTPKGDTIYFLVSGPWVDTFIMKSDNNGDTWTKIPILGNANKKLPAGTTDVAPFTSSDGSCAIEMDNNGVFHAAFGIGGGYMSGGDKYIYINRNGLVYWNSTMPMVMDSLDLDTLEAHGQLLGAVYNGPGPGDTIIDAPSYRVGLASFPQIAIDGYNNIYFLWSAVTPGNPSPDPYNYRHIWGRAKYHDKPAMTEQFDFNGGIMYLFNEYVYPTLARRVLNDKLYLYCQTAAEPGSNIVSTTIPTHECNIEYREILCSSFAPTAIGENKGAIGQVGEVFPNPASDVANVGIILQRPSDVSVQISGISGNVVMALDKGHLSAGNHKVTINTSSLEAGLYLCTVRTGGESYSRKLIIR